MSTADLLPCNSIPATFEQIERRRKSLGVSVLALTRQAGVSYQAYWRMRTGRSKALWTVNRKKLAAALDKAPIRGTARAVSPSLLRATFRAYVALLAAELGVDAAAVLASDPQRRANLDAAWKRAAHVRALAVYCVVIEFDLPAARVAAAIGVTRAAASQMLRRVEELRDDPAVEALVERVGRLVSGRDG